MVSGCRFSHARTLAAAIVAMAASATCPEKAHARPVEDATQAERQTLNAALFLVDRAVARLPIVLTAMMPDIASPGIQGWTSMGPDGNGERIFIYTGSDVFRCARPSNENRQCVVKLASVIVHEAWHFRHGGSESGAYTAQLTFLLGNQAAAEHVTDVRRSRDRAVAAERRAVEAARRLSGRPEAAR